ncbi:helix-turn-helix transcriptional regulator [Antarcticibacterium sp. 1MA-6-2]|uniref:helix-turn-helix domain-containing protein n=1 Tax=Antarcticibacterium sp. 1MA-6-2 TaxID=2908210 RepID=UPI001F24B09A|nr:helix-turn-helix transcriptional regulator [Antarcticibacterium sp. 1MA-6-2]UJH89679.1 helix-turn-helix transcriptional regulator [Antarcticibacterium sp. 1MA-6-2]
MTTSTKTNHIGRKIARIRELRGMKQETLAEELGLSQQSVSHLEQSETLEEEKLEKVAKVLGVTKEAIENFSEDHVINYFNNFYDNSASQGNSFNQGIYPTFNPLDKLVEAYEENKKLYERLVQAEKDKVAYLEKLLKK